MTNRIFNFSAGPATLPVEVLEEARENLLSLGATGIGIMEHSHRGNAFMEVYDQTVSRCREVAAIPDDYEILFTAAPEVVTDLAKLGDDIETPLSRIGKITSGGGARVIGADGAVIDIENGGFTHF